MPDLRKEHSTDEHLFLRSVTMDDAQILFDWANDPETRRNSFSTKPIVWDEHVNWLVRKLRDKTSRIYILSNEIDDIGTIRLDFQEKEESYLISYSVGSCFRGQGYGTKILRLAEDQAKRLKKDNPNAKAIVGKVKGENIASIRCFEKAGFQRSQEKPSEIVFQKNI